MNHPVIFGTILLAALVAVVTFSVLGGVVALPDGSRRFSFRLWAWLNVLTVAWSTFAGVRHHTWWLWAWYLSVFVYALGRVRHWWRITERTRAAERQQPWRVQR